MKMPKLSELSEAQKQVYLYAPTDNHVLVNGPPGTGKTVIAVLRAIELGKKGVPASLAMFNRVLKSYTSNTKADKQNGVTVQTMNQWFNRWWSECRLPPSPASQRIVLQVSYGDKDRVKELGAHFEKDGFRPWERQRGGIWWVDFPVWISRIEAFSEWSNWPDPPSIPGSFFSIDWDAVCQHILAHDEAIPDSALDLGSFLIDEGQDFPEAMYKTLHVLSALANSRRHVKRPLRCFVLADENQQLTERNSTLEQIAAALQVKPDHRFSLLDNFRNSKEVAILASSFYSDVGERPRLPSRMTMKPVLSMRGGLDDLVSIVKAWLVNNPKKELGIFTFKDTTRKTVYACLEPIMQSFLNRSVRFQTYSSQDANCGNKELIFDLPDTVSVLNIQSCKGLEFDAVFIVNFHDVNVSAYGADRFKMQLFVGVSRARDWVQLVETTPEANWAAHARLFPGEDILVRDRIPSAANQATLVKRHHQDEAAERPEGRYSAHAPESAPLPSAPVSPWDEAARAIARKQGGIVIDNRPTGGAFWVIGSRHLEEELGSLGFRYSEAKKGWWKK